MKFKTALGSFLVLFLMVGTALALPINTTSGGFFNNILHDTSGEYLLTGGDTTVDVGDILSGDIIIDRINTTEIGTGTGYEELTAHFAVQVTSVSLVDALDPSQGYNYTFGSTVASGELAWFYLDASGNATLSNPATLTDGSLWATFGLTDADTSWTAWTISNDILVLAGLVNSHPTTSAQYGNFEFYLDVIQNNTGLTFNDVGVDNTQLQGNGHFTAVTSDYDTSTYVIGDQADMSINVVPEPATLSLLGLGLLGLAGIARRRN